jgi:hypothetical protein
MLNNHPILMGKYKKQKMDKKEKKKKRKEKIRGLM